MNIVNNKFHQRQSSQNKKGLEPIVATVVLVSIALMTAILIFQWQGGFVQSYTSDIKDDARQQLRCDKADISIVNITFDCSACNLSVKVKNQGEVDIRILKIYATSTSQKIHEFPGAYVAMGDVKTLTNNTSACSELKNSISDVHVLTECSGVGDDTNIIAYVGC